MDGQQRQRVHHAIVRLAEGDRDAFACVFEELWPELLAFTRRAMPGSPDAEDLAQQALLKVFSRISSSTRLAMEWRGRSASLHSRSEHSAGASTGDAKSAKCHTVCRTRAGRPKRPPWRMIWIAP